MCSVRGKVKIQIAAFASQIGQVGKYLPEVIVVRLLKLILDDYGFAVGTLANHIAFKTTSRNSLAGV